MTTMTEPGDYIVRGPLGDVKKAASTRASLWVVMNTDGLPVAVVTTPPVAQSGPQDHSLMAVTHYGSFHEFEMVQYMAKETERQRKRAAALAKLTEEEQELLGIR